MRINNYLKDITGINRVSKNRENKYKEASDQDKNNFYLNEVAKKLHPGKIELEVVSIEEASKTSKTITFTSPDIPLFKAGTYLTLRKQIGESILTRPYSISSSRKDYYKDLKTISITVKNSDEIFSRYLYNDLKVGEKLISEIGLGEFYYNPIRDSKNVIGIAGGSGITPFLAMAYDIIDFDLDYTLTILYGSVSLDDIVLKEKLDNLNSPKIKIVHILSGDNPLFEGEKGFITKDIIKKYMGDDPTFFICGPNEMKDFVLASLEELNIPSRRIRIESYNKIDLLKLSDYPKEMINKVFNITINIGLSIKKIKAYAKESILNALERNGILINSACRGGSCGYCRLKVIEGEYYYHPALDGRRRADKEFNYIHSFQDVVSINL